MTYSGILLYVCIYVHTCAVDWPFHDVTVVVSYVIYEW